MTQMPEAMKKMIRLVLLLYSVVLCSGCGDAEVNSPPKPMVIEVEEAEETEETQAEPEMQCLRIVKGWHRKRDANIRYLCKHELHCFFCYYERDDG